MKKNTMPCTVVLLLLLLPCLLAVEIKWTHSFSKEWLTGANTIFVFPRNHIGHRDDGFLYATCSPSELVCTLTLDEQISDRAWSTDTCLLNATEHSNGQEFTGKVKLMRFYDDVAVVTWIMSKDHKSEYSITATVNARMCAVSSISSDLDEVKILPVENYATNWDNWQGLGNVDQVLSGQKMCGYPGSCRITFKALNARIVGGPIRLSMIDVPHTELSVVAVSTSTFLHYITKPEGEFRLVHVDADGKDKELLRSVDLATGMTTTSNAHQLFGICWLQSSNEASVLCKQFSANGEELLSLKVPFNRNINALAVYNLPNKGLLLLDVGQCLPQPFAREKTLSCTKFDVSALIEARGFWRTRTLVGIPGTELNCKPDSMLALDITESDSEFCFYMACSHDRTGYVPWQTSRSRLMFNKKCTAKKSIELATLDI